MDENQTDEVIAAAGVVLWRRLTEDLLQVALIHRPRYDDWSFPKGKVELGESEISTAFREAFEETAMSAPLVQSFARLSTWLVTLKKQCDIGRPKQLANRRR